MVYCRCEAPRILISFNLIAASGFRVGDHYILWFIA